MSIPGASTARAAGWDRPAADGTKAARGPDPAAQPQQTASPETPPATEPATRPDALALRASQRSGSAPQAITIGGEGIPASEARSIARQLLTNPNQHLDAGDPRIDPAALAVADCNGDGRLDRRELTDALISGTVTFQKGRIVAAESRQAAPTPGPSPQDAGLRPTPWMQGTFIPGGDPRNPPLANRVGSRLAGPEFQGIRANLSDSDVNALKGQSFATVATAARTPEDVARFLDWAITYEDERAADHSQGTLGSRSSAETLALGTGVCRDQHALARDLLKANGYEATLLGYAASNQSHAITAYQDKETGKWGILEYGTLYTPEQLQANSPEEALLMVRPATLTITRFSDAGPDQRSHVTGIVYTPTSRAFEDFMAGPGLQAGNGVSLTNQGVTANLQSANGRWQGSMRVLTDARTPHLQGTTMVGAWRNFADGGFRVGVGGGYAPKMVEHRIGSNEAIRNGVGFAFVSAEEYHPNLLRATNVAGSGLNVTAGSHTRAQAMLFTGPDGEGGTRLDVNGATLGASSLKWNPTLTVDRRFDLFGDGGQESRAFATYGVGVDAGLLTAHWATGGNSLPLNQYVNAGFETRPTDWLSLNAQGYVPITNHTNDFAASSLVRLEASTPWLRVGTTQGRDQAAYDVQSNIAIGKRLQLGAFGQLQHDRRSGEVNPVVGIQLGRKF